MSTGGIFVIAIVVFGLMIAGLVISMNEFLEMSDDPSSVKDSDTEG